MTSIRRTPLLLICFIVLAVTVSMPRLAGATSQLLGKWGYEWFALYKSEGDSGKGASNGSGVLTFDDGSGGTTYDYGTGSENWLENASDIDTGPESYTDTFTWNTTPLGDGTYELTMTYDSDGETESYEVAISDNGNVMIFNGTGYVDEVIIINAVKIDTAKTYANADLTGDYYAIRYGYNEAPSESHVAESSIVTFDDAIAELVNIDWAENNNGVFDASNDPTSDPYTVNSDGSVDVGGEIGHLAGNGNAFVIPFLNTQGSYEFKFGLKRGDLAYTASDLSGRWILSSIGDDGSLIDGEFATWGYMDCDATANCTTSGFSRKNYKGNFESHLPPFGTFTVSSDGSLALSSYFGDSAPAYAGAIGNAANTMILNPSFDSAYPDLRETVVAVRCDACGQVGLLGAIEGTTTYTGGQSGTGIIGVYPASTLDCIDGPDTKPIAIDDSWAQPGSYSINVPDGTYYVLASIATGPGGDLYYTDPSGTYTNCTSASSVTVSSGGTVTAIDFELVDGTSTLPNLMVDVFPDTYAYSIHDESLPTYYAYFTVRDPFGLATSVSVDGPGIVSGPISLSYDAFYNEWSLPSGYDLGTSPPSTPASYTVDIFDGTNTRYRYPVIDSFVGPFASNLSPASVTVTEEWPTFSWDSACCDNYSYRVEVFDDTSAKMWESTDTTAYTMVYDGPHLEPLTTYTWYVVTYDQNWNSSISIEQSFTYDGPPPPRPVYLVWYDNESGRDEIYFTRSTDDGLTWETPKIISWPAIGGNSITPDIAIEGSDVYVVWTEDFGTYSEILMRKSSDYGQTWTVSGWLTNDGTLFNVNPKVAAANGFAYFIYQNNYSGSQDLLLKWSNDGGYNWRHRPVTLTSGIEQQNPDIAADGNDLYIVWDSDIYNPGGTRDIRMAYSYDNGETLNYQKISRRSGDSVKPKVDTVSTNVKVIWQNDLWSTAGTYEVFLRSSTDGATSWDQMRKKTYDASAGIDIMPAFDFDSTGEMPLLWVSTKYDVNGDIFMKRSTDGGSTWLWHRRFIAAHHQSSGFPSVALNGTGLVTAWSDNAHTIGGTTDILVRTSSDNGAIFTSPIRITDTVGDSKGPVLAW